LHGEIQKAFFSLVLSNLSHNKAINNRQQVVWALDNKELSQWIFKF